MIDVDLSEFQQFADENGLIFEHERNMCTVLYIKLVFSNPRTGHKYTYYVRQCDICNQKIHDITVQTIINAVTKNLI